MPARRLCLAALLLVPLSSGCGGAALSPAADSHAGRLTIYSSLPLQGPSSAIARQILAGERLALAEAGGRVGRLRIRLVSLDDSSPRARDWDPGVTEANAKLAARDPTAIAYLGDYDSGATAVSLPLTNAADIPQVSPWSPYVGLTSSLYAGEDEPARFYPSGVRTFARLAPGDRVEAGAQVALLRALGVRSVYVLCDEDPFDGPLAQLLAADARQARIAVRAIDALEVPWTPGDFTAEVARVGQAMPEAVFFSGAGSPGAASLFEQLHAALPAARLIGSASLARAPFLSALGNAAPVTLLGTPALPASAYPPAAGRVLSEYSRRHRAPASTYLLYGYEAMSVVIAAVRAAGAHAEDRRAVLRRLLATRARRSVLGEYSIDPSGETTLREYGIERVRGGTGVFWRALRG